LWGGCARFTWVGGGVVVWCVGWLRGWFLGGVVGVVFDSVGVVRAVSTLVWLGCFGGVLTVGVFWCFLVLGLVVLASRVILLSACVIVVLFGGFGLGLSYVFSLLRCLLLFF